MEAGKQIGPLQVTQSVQSRRKAADVLSHQFLSLLPRAIGLVAV